MSGAGFLWATTSPARTRSKRAARSGPAAWSRMARTDASAEVEATASVQPASCAALDDPADPRPGRQPALRPPSRCRSPSCARASAASSAAWPSGSVGQPGRRDEAGRQQRGHPLLAAADPEQPAVLLLRPLHRQAELAEGLVEGRQVAEALGVGEDAVAVEDERGHQRPCPRCRTCGCGRWPCAMTAARWARKSDGGSYSPGCSVMKS